MFSINPNDAYAQQSVVEAVWGLGEGLVSGDITPHHYVVSSVDGAIFNQVNTTQLQKYACITIDGISGVSKIPTTETEAQMEPLSTTQLAALVHAGTQLACRQGLPQDFEWCVAEDGQMYLVQMRPVTAFSFPSSCG